MFGQIKSISVIRVFILAFLVLTVSGCSTVMNFKQSTAQKDVYDLKIFPGTFTSKESELKLLDKKAMDFASFMHYKSYKIVNEVSDFGYPVESDNGEITYMVLGVQKALYTKYTLLFER